MDLQNCSFRETTEKIDIKCFMYSLFLFLKLIPRRKMRVKVDAPLKPVLAPSNYYLPSQGGTFVAVSSVLCSVGWLFVVV